MGKKVIIVGTQWGDEGKGKIIDILTEFADVIVRFQGGSNAGHTVVIGNEQFILHQIPSGILHSGKKCIVGNGVVLDPQTLTVEIEELKAKGRFVQEENLLISEKAHLVMPYHKKIDIAREEKRGSGKIGTTGRGIGPAYEDKAARCGIRFIDFLDRKIFSKKNRDNLESKNYYFKNYFQENDLKAEEIDDEYRKLAEKLKKYAADTSLVIDREIRAGKNILFEGAQGTFLDVDHGTYPFVTSSNTVAGAACSGSGVGPTQIDSVIGVAKAYTTRVGSGPFPAELNDQTGEVLRDRGGEYGATTGRPRRCGWFDATMVKHSKRINGLTGLILTKLDVLSGFEKIKICVGYQNRDKCYYEVPSSLDDWYSSQPLYEEVDGWEEELSSIRNVADLPGNARNYVKRIEELLEIEIILISLGNKREETILLKNPFN